jgi:PTS system nitrogen regulatory IIA component
MATDMLKKFSFNQGTIKITECFDKFDAIRELIVNAPVFQNLTNKDILEDAVVSREKIMSTGIGRGVAVAHGMTNAVDKIMVALGISEQGIPFGSPDGKPVNFLFLVAHPPCDQNKYLEILSAIAKMLVDESLRKELLTTSSTADIELKIGAALDICLCNREKNSDSNCGQLLIHSN